MSCSHFSLAIKLVLLFLELLFLSIFSLKGPQNKYSFQNLLEFVVYSWFLLKKLQKCTIIYFILNISIYYLISWRFILYLVKITFSNKFMLWFDELGSIFWNCDVQYLLKADEKILKIMMYSYLEKLDNPIY